jgi:hypothetical protein
MSDLRILLVGTIVAGGEIDWHIAPLPVEEDAPDGELQRIIDQGEMTAEYADWLEDVEWLRQGGS